MGCGPQLGEKRLTKEEQQLILHADTFRQKVIDEVSVQRLNNPRRTSQQTAEDVGKRASWSIEDIVRRTSCRTNEESRRSVTSEMSEYDCKDKTSFPKKGTRGGSISSLSFLSVPETVRRQGSIHSAASLKSDCHVSPSSAVGSEIVGVTSLTVCVPGKVGCEDDKVTIGKGGTHRIMRTKKVHRFKREAKKAMAHRLDSIEKADTMDIEDIPLVHEARLSAEERRTALKVLQRHFLFSALSNDEHILILNQMFLQESQKGDVICNKGEQGDACYIILSGILSVRKDATQVAQLSAGHTFGELSMLYDVPRTATIVCASSRAVLSVIRGATFKRSLAKAKESARSDTLGFLNTHSIFSKLAIEEKKVLANSFTLVAYQPETLIIDENLSHTAEWLFVLQEGTVEVTDQYRNRKVLGEGAIISGQRMLYGHKVAIARALSRVRCLSIGLVVMNKLFGNISEVIRRSTVRSFLEPIGFYQELSEQEQMKLAAVFQDQTVRNGEVIVSALADPQLVIVMEGVVSVMEMTDGPPHISNSGRFRAMRSLNSYSTYSSTTKNVDSSQYRVPDILDGSENVLPGHVQERTQEVHGCCDPEIELPPQCLAQLRRGDVYGEDAFKEHGRMQHSLVASSDAVVCRAGLDEVCQTLRGCAEKTPPISWIILRNQAKRCVKSIFPFSSLHDDVLDMMIEALELRECMPHAPIIRLGEVSRRFLLLVDGEAVKRDEGSSPEPFERWNAYGTQQLFLNWSNDADIFAAAAGCSIVSITHENFLLAVGGISNELQIKMYYQDLSITMDDIKVNGTLGQGHFGVVHRVGIRGVPEDRSFALKHMSKKKILESGQAASITLEREILCAFCHPFIVRLIKTFQDNHSVYLLMEMLSGGDLFTAIREIGTLTEEHTLFFSASLVLAVEYIHSRGLMYRDLKPENIMLTSEGFIKIVDFGCCSRKFRSYTFVGTPEYLAPEVIMGNGYGRAVDWWSLGVLIYEMLCGPLPFGNGATDALEIFKDVLEKPLMIPVKVSEEAADLLTSLLERMPEQRLGSSIVYSRSEVRHHAFFEALQWDALIEQTIHPPYVPRILSSFSPRCSIMSPNPAGFDAVTSIEIPQIEHDDDPSEPDTDADLSFFEGF